MIFLPEIDLSSALNLKLDKMLATVEPAVGEQQQAVSPGPGSGRADVLLFSDISGLRSKLNTSNCSSFGRIVVRREAWS
jgi:hypothetical protein